ncbi:MAG TPA: hypothetical protein PKZ75_09160 [Bacteroidia bacterium]|nr:hypothetical protein [Bacteroidia bacterium]
MPKLTSYKVRVATYLIIGSFVPLMPKVKTRTAEIYLDKDLILHIVMLNDVVVDYEDALDNFLVVKRFVKERHCCKLIDIRCKCHFEAKAKQFLDTKDVQGKTLCRALLINSSVKKITLNYFLKFNSQKVPTKFFTEYNEAISWLKSYKQTI